MDQFDYHRILGEHIEELKEVAEIYDFRDLENRLAFAEYLGDCEDWFKNNIPVENHCCSLCGGEGHFKEYDYEWPCDSCFGTGVSYFKI